MAEERIDDWRRKIDSINERILKLLSQRGHCVQKIGEIKKQRNLKVYSQKRENEIIKKLEHKNKGPYPNKSIKEIFKTIMRESRNLEKDI